MRGMKSGKWAAVKFKIIRMGHVYGLNVFRQNSIEGTAQPLLPRPKILFIIQENIQFNDKKNV